jgi:hypothetical protein
VQLCYLKRITDNSSEVLPKGEKDQQLHFWLTLIAGPFYDLVRGSMSKPSVPAPIHRMHLHQWLLGAMPKIHQYSAYLLLYPSQDSSEEYNCICLVLCKCHLWILDCKSWYRNCVAIDKSLNLCAFFLKLPELKLKIFRGVNAM